MIKKRIKYSVMTALLVAVSLSVAQAIENEKWIQAEQIQYHIIG